jgi:hypothetical protein
MNSIPQQAVAKGSGQSEFDRAQATIVSSFVVRKSAGPPPVSGLYAGSALLFPNMAGILTTKRPLDAAVSE